MLLKMILLYLTCANQTEAETIATALLEKQLVACVKMTPVTSKFLWQGSVDSAQEILLIMDSEESKFKQIEEEVRKLHSYTTFVLTSVEVKQSSAGVQEWMQESIKS